MKRRRRIFECDGKEILRYVEHFHKTLTHLRYEGKVSLGKNIKALRGTTKVLNALVKRHRYLQEKILFPFLERHIPKYETRIHFLRSDHQEIRKHSQRFTHFIQSLSKKAAKDRPIDNGTIHESGVYFVCLLRHHIQLEEQAIHKVLKKDLKRHERGEIAKKMQNWITARNGKRKRPI